MAATKLQILPPTLSVRNSLHSLIALLVATLVIVVVYLSHNGGQLLEDCDKSKNSGESNSKCDMFSGRWVFDNKSYPLYGEKQCTFMSDQLACEKFGRQDLSFRNWRWQPHHCDIPRSAYKYIYIYIVILYKFIYSPFSIIFDFVTVCHIII